MNTRLDHLRSQLNGETAKADWQELQPFFAKGQLVRVSATLDLVEVAAHVADDDTAYVSQLMQSGTLARLDDATAMDWEQRRPAIWTVVLAPWILVQEAAH